MPVAYWAAKGGAGATVVAAAHALVAASAPSARVVLVDLGGDVPAALGRPEPERPGLAEWLSAGDEVPVDAVARLVVPLGRGLGLLPRGRGPLLADRAPVLGALLSSLPGTVVVDAGTGPCATVRALLARADRSVLVTRACFLAVRRAALLDVRPTEVVIVREARRSISSADVAEAVGAPVRAEIPHDPLIARAVDAGLLSVRLPRMLERAVRPLVGTS